MKINLLYSEEESAYVMTGKLLLPRTTPGDIAFTVDTGSPTSFIGAVDAGRLKIKFSPSTKPNKIYWGNKEFKLSILHNLNLWIVGEQDGVKHLKVMKFPQIEITKDFVHTEEGKMSPSLLGLDFLFNNGLKLVIDGKTKEAYLEDI